MSNQRGFASDNNSGVHPEVFAAMQACNEGHVVGYGDDVYTEQAVSQLKNIFGKDTEIYFVFTGTAANVIGLRNITHSFNSVICAETAHIEEDECGAPEFFTGCKIIPVPASGGKINAGVITPHLRGFDFEHHAQPRVVSITQATELGTVYRPGEIRALSEVIKPHGMYLHMDGARIANAAAFLEMDLKSLTRDAGVDVLSLGATKNGGMYGEAIIFMNSGLADFFKYYRKQGMQLASKMRYIAAQFTSLFSNDLWLQNARHSNRMARYLADQIAGIPEIKITQPVESNGVFAQVPASIIPKLQQEFFFYVWDESRSIVRWMTSWDTTPEDIDRFCLLIKQLVG